MKVTTHVDGFGFTSDDAIDDAMRRGKGSTVSVTVRNGTNPYSVIPVYGYVATAVIVTER